MKLTVTIQTSTGSMEFNRGEASNGYGRHSDWEDLRSAAKELQGIANAVTSMTNTTPVVQISENSMTAAAEAAIREYRQELVAKSKAGKKAAAERRNAS